MTLQVEQLAVGYGQMTAVWDMSLEVSAGQVVAIIGRNGAGKTTLLSAVAGVLKPTKGRIVFEGQDITRTSPHERVVRGISLVQEGKRIFRKLSVEDNLVLGTYSLPGSRRKTLKAIDGAFSRFPILAERRAQQAGSLSGGQQQMLAIAQALLAQPKVLLLDEPSAGLAPVVTAEVFEVVGQLRDEGLAIVLVEQLIEDAIELADHVIVVDVGRVIASGPPSQVDVAAKLRSVEL
jgi:branched-chain amino acid transport system ATP-binding protein